MTIAALDSVIPAEPGEEGLDILAATERSALAAAIMYPDQIDVLVDGLDVAHFRDPMHQAVFSCMVEMYGKGIRTEGIAVLQAIATSANLEPYQRKVLLEYMPQVISNGLNGSATLAIDMDHIRTAAAQRLAGQMSIRLHQVAATSTAEELEAALGKMCDVFSGAIRPSGTSARSGMGGLINRLVDRADSPVKRTVIPPPYRDMASMMRGGYRPGQVILVGARPAVGKSVSGLDTARTALENGFRTLLVSLEMPEEEIAARFLAATARVNLNKTSQIEEHPELLTDDEWFRIAQVQADVDKLDDLLVLVDPRSMQDDTISAGMFTPTTLRRHLLAMKKLGTPADIVVLDYIQLMKSGDRAENRQNEVTEISRSLKLLAIEFNIPIVIMAQLNRNPEGRQDKRPQVADLRESGSLENDADMVMLLHREDLNSSEPNGPKAGEMEVIVGKNRNGPTGSVFVAFQGHYSRAVDMASGR
jgi:replicative DNA helicase